MDKNSKWEEQMIPLGAISKGRDLSEVLDAYMSVYNDAVEIADDGTRDSDATVADAMVCAAYRVYLLGVEDGMKGANR